MSVARSRLLFRFFFFFLFIVKSFLTTITKRRTSTLTPTQCRMISASKKLSTRTHTLAKQQHTNIHIYGVCMFVRRTSLASPRFAFAVAVVSDVDVRPPPLLLPPFGAAAAAATASAAAAAGRVRRRWVWQQRRFNFKFSAKANDNADGQTVSQRERERASRREREQASERASFQAEGQRGNGGRFSTHTHKILYSFILFQQFLLLVRLVFFFLECTFCVRASVCVLFLFAIRS